MQISIRPLKIEDAKISYKWRNNPIIWKYTGTKPDRYITPEIETEWITKVLQNTNEKRYAIIAENEYIGNIQLLNITKQSADYHIFIGNTDYWGKGIAAKASELLIEEAKKLKLQYINLKVHKDNMAANKLYKKLGFRIKSSEDEKYIMELKLY